MVGRYKIDKGNILYSNKRFDTKSNRIWLHYGKNMSRSKVNWFTIFSDIDVPSFIKDMGKKFNETLPVNPTVNFWKSRSQDPAFAVTESFFSMTEVETSPELEIIGIYLRKFNDRGFPASFRPNSGHVIVDNPAHEQTDADGTIWASTLDIEMYHVGRMDNLEAAVVVYKVKGKDRTLVARHVLGKYNLSRCGSLKQPDLDVMPGYAHYIQTTANYILVPQTSYRFDYCIDYSNRRTILPGFLRSYAWHPEVNTSILVFERGNMSSVHHVYLPFAKFLTHDLNAFEDKTHIYLDTLAYDDADPYLQVPLLKNVVADYAWNVSIIRIAIDKQSWRYDAGKSGPLTENDPLAKVEFPAINYERNHQKDYTFTYFVTNALYRGSKITKLNIKTKKTIEWTPPFGFYPQEPVFVQAEDAKAEDDGIILCSGPVSNPAATSFLAILDAKNLKQIALVRNPNAAPFGLHNRFYKRGKNIKSASSVVGVAWLLQTMFLCLVTSLAIA